MSLKAWYPFDGDFKNYGVGNLNLIQVTAPTYVTPGKLGSKALSTGSFKWTAEQTASVFNNQTISIAFWIKIIDASGSQILFGNNDSRHYALFNYQTMNDLHFSWKNESTDAAPWTNGNTVVSGAFPTNTWTHCCIVYDNPKGYIYINGELVHEFSGANPTTSFDEETIIIHNSSKRYLQDFRVYDHALSPREAKLLAQGLILHLPLKDGSMENTTNLAPYPSYNGTPNREWEATLHTKAIKVTGGWSDGYNGGVSSSASGYHAHWELVDGIPTIVFPDINSSLGLGHRWLGINLSGMQTNIKAGVTYTVSFDAKATVEGLYMSSGLYYKYGSNSHNFHDTKEYIALSTNWKRYSYTRTTKTTMDTNESAYMYFYGHEKGENQPNTVNGVSYVRNIQIELKDHATAYTPTSRIAFVSDNSGYNRQGTVVGTVKTASNSARYDYCLYQSDGRSNYIKSGTLTMPSDKVTLSCWFKASAAGYSDYHIPISFRSDAAPNSSGENYELSVDPNGKLRSGFKINGSRSAATASSQSVSMFDGKWHLLTTSFDGSTIRRYFDGQEIAANATSVSGTLSGGSGNILVGNYNGTTYGSKNAYTSDVRIYATALSAEDIKLLYEIRATMTDKNDLMAYEFIEDSPTNMKFTSTGLSRSGGVNETIPTFGMPIKHLPDGSAWARINWLDVKTNKTVFASTSEVAQCINQSNRFSLMGRVDDFIGKRFKITNLMPAVTSVNYSNLTLDNTYKRHGTGSIKITGTTSVNEVTFNPTTMIYYTPGHTYYCRCDILQETVQGSCDMYWKVAEPYLMGGRQTSAAKTWTTASAVRAASTVINRNGSDWDAGNYAARWDYNNNKANGAMWFNGFMLIDLTEAFGAGKEPTAAWCDANIPYFVGTKTIEINDPNVGWYEFMLTYPSKSLTEYNRWKQTNSPNVAANAGTGFVKITQGITQTQSAYFQPLTKSASSGSAVYSTNTSSNWWSPVGQLTLFNSTGIPAADGSTQTEMELWVRIDTLPTEKRLSMFDNKYIQAFNIYEF